MDPVLSFSNCHCGPRDWQLSAEAYRRKTIVHWTFYDLITLRTGFNLDINTSRVYQNRRNSLNWSGVRVTRQGGFSRWGSTARHISLHRTCHIQMSTVTKRKPLMVEVVKNCFCRRQNIAQNSTPAARWSNKSKRLFTNWSRVSVFRVINFSIAK